MSGIAVQKMAERVAELMELRLHVRGRTLKEKLRRGARLLPRKVRKNAEYLAEVAALANMPTMQMRLDHQKIAEAYDICVLYLKPLGASARRRVILLEMVTGIAAAAVVTLVMTVVLLVWRGFL